MITNSLLINLNQAPTLPFDCAEIKEHQLFENISFEKERFKCVSTLEPGESFTTGHVFMDRLKMMNDVLIPNSNLIDFLSENQDEAEVQGFLSEYSHKTMYSFGSIFKNPNFRNSETVRYLYQSGTRWFTHWSILNRIQWFQKQSMAIVIAK